MALAVPTIPAKANAMNPTTTPTIEAALSKRVEALKMATITTTRHNA